MLPRKTGHLLLAAVGLVLVAAQALLIPMTRGLTHVNVETIAKVMPLILGLAMPGALLLLAGPRIVRVAPSPLAWALLAIVGLLMRAVWFGQVPPLDDDFFRYLWDGAVVAHGLDPYLHAPLDLVGHDAGPEPYRALARGVQGILESINFNDMRSIYPSVAQAAFAAAHRIAPFKVDGLRIVFLGGEIATFALLIVLLRATGRSPFWSALYWWNPLAAFMTVGLAHVDALIPPLVLGAVLLLARSRANGALVLIGLGAGVKIWPLLLAPLVLWPMIRDSRRLAIGCAVLGSTLAVTVGPVLLSTLHPGSGLSAYAGGWSNNNAFYAWSVVALRAIFADGEAAERGLRLVLAAATAGIALYQGVRGATDLDGLLRRALVVAAAVFYLSPAQFPWYAVWFLPLAAVSGSWPLLLASALLPFYYLYFPPWPLEDGSLFFYGIAFIHSLPVLGWLLMLATFGRQTGPDVRGTRRQ